MNPTVRAFIGLGGNLGAAEIAVRTAIAALDGLPATRLLRASRLYRTPAWGLREQPDFINAVAEIDTALSPRALLDALLSLERAAGRERTPQATRWGPRALDLDILLYGGQSIDTPELRIPHPHLHERAFALVPLMELAPDLPLPGHGTVRDARAGVAADGIEAIP